MKIVWQETDSWPIMCGHGVEFHAQHVPHDDILIAFLEGYQWREDPSGEVVIKIRKSDSRFPKKFLTGARKAIEEALLAGRLRQGPLGSQIMAWFNG